MKKFVLTLALTFMSGCFGSAWAQIPDGTYDCRIHPQGSEVSGDLFLFRVADRKLTCLQKYKDGRYCKEWFFFAKNSSKNFFLNGLYGGGYLHNQDGDFVVMADADGCSLGKLVLYRSSGYQKGYIRSEFNCNRMPPRHFGKVFCQRK